MTGVSQLNQFPCKSLWVASSQPQISSKPSLFRVNLFVTTKKSLQGSKFSVRESTKARPVFRVRAESEDEWGTENEPASADAVVEKEPTEIDLLKKQLVESFYGTNRGLSATSETRAEIVELITQLEAKNPAPATAPAPTPTPALSEALTPAPTEALTLLNGKWILSYTSFVGLYPLLSGGSLPLLKVEEISQTIDSENFTVQNSVQFSGPFSTTSISTNAKFEVRSPKLVQIKFEEGIIGTPQLTDSIVFPENVEFLGQNIDLTPFKGLITSVQDTASSVAKTISSQPPLKFSFSNGNAESWLLTTYLDEELRISRGDGGSVFVLIKEGSSLLSP